MDPPSPPPPSDVDDFPDDLPSEDFLDDDDIPPPPDDDDDENISDLQSFSDQDTPPSDEMNEFGDEIESFIDPPVDDEFFPDDESLAIQSDVDGLSEDSDLLSLEPDNSSTADIPPIDPVSLPIAPRSNFRQSFSLVPPSMSVSDNSAQNSQEFVSDLDFTSLSTGLVVKDQHRLWNSKTVKIVEPSNACSLANETVSDQFHSNSTFVETSNFTTSPSISRNVEGFVGALAKYDGDPFETIFVKVDKVCKVLLAELETGERMTFDLSHNAFIFEDTVESNTIVLDYRREIIVVKFASSDELVEFMKNMPDEVFLATDMSLEEETHSVKTTPISKKNVSSSLTPPTDTSGSGPKIEHIKGTSVEDILENDFETTQERQEKIEQMFDVKESLLIVRQPPRRKELIDSHLRKPQYSVRRVGLLCEWINCLHIWSNKVSITCLHREMCNGILLARIVKKLYPEARFVNLNEKPLARKAALQNLEQALGQVWRAKSLNNSRIPTAENIYSGNTAKTAVLINELFGVYVVRPIMKNALKILKWYHHVLKQYDRPLPSYVFDEGDLSAVWPHFQSGAALFCVIYHFFGQTSIGTSSGSHRVDPLRIVGDPKSICDFRDNLTYVFHLLRLLGVDILWSVEDWISNPDTEFILLQLSYIYDFFRYRQCTLPPAQGDRPGLTSGPNGEALVAGFVFSDAPTNLRFVPHAQKAVRLGHDKDSMLLLPIEKITANTRFFSHGILPQGMLSQSHVRVSGLENISVDVTNFSQKNEWNARTTLHTDKEYHDGLHVVKLLRGHHKHIDLPRQETKSHISSTPPKTPAGQQSAVLTAREEASREIDEMVRALEDEMIVAQRRMSAFQDELAQKYSCLESSLDNSSLEQYELQLVELEKERLGLDEEKQQLQDYFGRKLALIRARKDEIQHNYLAQQQATFSAALMTQALCSREHGATLSRKIERKIKTNSTLNVSTAEKGWIALSAKMETHNFHLRNKQALSVAAFQTKITPKALLKRERYELSFENNTRNNEIVFQRGIQESDSCKMLSILGCSPEISIHRSFQNFLDRLRRSSDKWRQSKLQQDRSHTNVTMNLSAIQSDLISIPIKSNVAHNNFEEGFIGVATESRTIHSSSLRLEELQIMFYEDERRRMVVAEKKFDQSVQLSQNLFLDLEEKKEEEIVEMDSSLRMHKIMNKFQELPPTIEEVENAVQFLSFERVVLMNDRIPKEFIFALVEIDEIVGVDKDIRYALEWKDLQISAVDPGAVGLVELKDIALVNVQSSYPGFILMVHIKESPKAIKHSKGRTVLPLYFNSEKDCQLFCQSLCCLHSIS